MERSSGWHSQTEGKVKARGLAISEEREWAQEAKTSTSTPPSLPVLPTLRLTTQSTDVAGFPPPLSSLQCFSQCFLLLQDRIYKCTASFQMNTSSIFLLSVICFGVGFVLTLVYGFGAFDCSKYFDCVVFSSTNGGEWGVPLSFGRMAQYQQKENDSYMHMPNERKCKKKSKFLFCKQIKNRYEPRKMIRSNQN